MGTAETWAMVAGMVVLSVALAFFGDPKARRWDGYLVGLAVFVGILAGFGIVLWKFG